MQERGGCLRPFSAVSLPALNWARRATSVRGRNEDEGAASGLTWLEDEGPAELNIARVALGLDAVARAAEQRADDECPSRADPVVRPAARVEERQRRGLHAPHVGRVRRPRSTDPNVRDAFELMVANESGSGYCSHCGVTL